MLKIARCRFIVFLFIRLHTPPNRIILPTPNPQSTRMSNPEERAALKAKLLADMERARAEMEEMERAEEEEKRRAEEEKKRVAEEKKRAEKERRAEEKRRAEEEKARHEEERRRREELAREEAEQAAEAARAREAQEAQGKKRARSESESESDGGGVVVGQTVVKDGVTWEATKGKVCAACAKAHRRCLWRVHKRARACYSCYTSKKVCDGGDGSENGPAKKKQKGKGKVASGSGVAAESEVGSGSGSGSGLEMMEKLLAEVKGMRDDMRLGMNMVRNELREIRKTGRQIAADVFDLTNHFIPDEEEEKETEKGAEKGAESDAEMAEQTLE